jgi:pimeloyl-ACP methyl ester carboxylesterase
MPHLALPSGRIEYRSILGSADRAPLVFLHEGLGSVALWRGFPDALCRAAGAPGLVYSRYGYGQSDGLGRPRTPRFMHEEALDVLPAILDRLAIERPILIGHSDGASIALIHAASAGRPVAAIVLIAPHVFVEPVTIAAIEAATRAYHGGGLRDRLQAYHADVDGAFLGWSTIWLSTEFMDWNLTPEIARLAMPSLLIQGSADQYGTLAHLERIEAGAPTRPRRYVIEGAGHAPFRDHEAAVIASVADFLSRVDYW